MKTRFMFFSTRFGIDMFLAIAMGGFGVRLCCGIQQRLPPLPIPRSKPQLLGGGIL